jgi:hypothetical protein
MTDQEITPLNHQKQERKFALLAWNPEKRLVFFLVFGFNFQGV